MRVYNLDLIKHRLNTYLFHGCVKLIRSSAVNVVLYNPVGPTQEL